VSPTADAYLWPDGSCLRNKLGIRDASELLQAEAEWAAFRDAQLAVRPLAGKYNLAHLQRFHKRLFGDVYDWAGDLRTVEMSKGYSVFARSSVLHSAGSELLDSIYNSRGMFIGLRSESFLEEITEILDGLNHLHPFREGNGRTQRAFLRQLAAGAGYSIDWSLLEPAENEDACMQAMRGHMTPLRSMLRGLVQRI
jgi:cell filamentation protein